MAELALNGGKKSKQKSFPEWPQYDDAERRALMEVLDSRVWWRTPGTRTLAFEQEFARFHGKLKGAIVIYQEPKSLSPPAPSDRYDEIERPLQQPPPRSPLLSAD